MLTTEQFNVAFRQLSKLGACDSPGGQEHKRVFNEWIAADRPDDIQKFIRTRANIGPLPQ
jgi:hypothetical protein